MNKVVEVELQTRPVAAGHTGVSEQDKISPVVSNAARMMDVCV